MIKERVFLNFNGIKDSKAFIIRVVQVTVVITEIEYERFQPANI